MLEKGKVSTIEFFILIIVFIIGGAILTLPAPLASIAKQDAWIAFTITTLTGFVFVFIMNQLISLYPSVTYVEFNEKILGKWLGKIASLVFLSYVFYLSTALLREIGNFFTTQILTETPIEFILIMFVLTCLYGVRLGLEVICRSVTIFFPWIILLFLMLFLLLFPEIKLEKIEPILGEGLIRIIRGSYNSLSLPYTQLIIFLMITPFVTEKNKVKKVLYSSTIIGGMTLTLLVFFCILVLGFDFTSRQSYPSYILGKKISIGDFLERIEVIVAVIWIFTIYFKVTFCYYVLSLGLAQVLGLKSYKILLFPLAFFLITFSLFLHPNVVHFKAFLGTAWTPYSLLVCFILPLILLGIGKIKKRGR
jgi:spore germination protein KB